MLEAQDAHEVLPDFPAELVMLLAESSHKSDDALVGVLETFDDEVGPRGRAISSGMVEIHPGCSAVHLKLRPFGRQVAVACRELVQAHPESRLEDVLADLRVALKVRREERLQSRRRQEYAALESVPLH